MRQQKEMSTDRHDKMRWQALQDNQEDGEMKVDQAIQNQKDGNTWVRRLKEMLRRNKRTALSEAKMAVFKEGTSLAELRLLFLNKVVIRVTESMDPAILNFLLPLFV